jgi:hypothetical protein
MLVEFAIVLFLQYTLCKERELHERSCNKQTQRVTHDTINVGLHQVSLPVTSIEFFPQCLDFLFMVFNCGKVGDDALVEVFDCTLQG